MCPVFDNPDQIRGDISFDQEEGPEGAGMNTHSFIKKKKTISANLSCFQLSPTDGSQAKTLHHPRTDGNHRIGCWNEEHSVDDINN